MISNPTVWSADTMVERLGGDDELARQLVSLFLTEYPRMMTAMRESIAGGVADTVRRAAHAFKGSVSNFIDDGPVTTALEIEILGKEGRLAEVPALFARLEAEVEQMVAGMREFDRAGSCES
jgi:HPt (histidine-containing phosphotransfer) domain-containing protein